MYFISLIEFFSICALLNYCKSVLIRANMPKKLNSRCKELVASLANYFEQERDNNGPFLPLTSVRERVAAALKLSVSTVSNISKAMKSHQRFKSPPKKRIRTKSVNNTAIVNTSGIRDTIYSMYEASKYNFNVCIIMYKI
jgi:hypothetical protein